MADIFLSYASQDRDRIRPLVQAFERRRLSITMATTRMTPAELTQEFAVFLFQRDKLTLGQASQLAGMGQWQFQQLLASRQIPIHYDVRDLEDDLQTLAEMKQS